MVLLVKQRQLPLNRTEQRWSCLFRVTDLRRRPEAQ